MIARLLQHAEGHPDHHAVVTPTFALSYEELLRLVRQQVARLTSAGITAQSVVGIQCANDTQHLLLCLAAIDIGATSCTLSSHESEQSRRSIATLCGVTHVLDDSLAIVPDVKSEVGAISVDQHSPARSRLLFATSGTTGEPKFVVHDAQDLVAQAHRHVESMHERFSCIASMEHNFVKRHRLYCVAQGATNVILDTAPDSLVQQCQLLNVNVLHVSGFQARELLSIPDIDKLSAIRLKLGGSHAPLALRQRLRAKVTCNLQAGYGTTETGAIGFTDTDDADAGESVGRPLPGIEVRVVSPERAPLASGERGEIAIKCAGMFRTYLGKRELTAARLDNGWFYTGDVGYLDSEQRIHLAGRADDMFVFNSMNIYPQDIESQICQHPEVVDAAVLPKTSAVHGDIPVALVVLSKSSREGLAAVRAYVRDRVGARSPRHYARVAEIPRNASGKIIRTETANLFARSQSLRSDIVRTIMTNTTHRLKPAQASAFERAEKDVLLKDIALDSLGRMDLMVMLEVEHGRVVSPETFRQFNSLDDICSWALSSRDAFMNADSVSSDVTKTFDQPISTTNEATPYVVRFFRRVFRHCGTAAQLNRALATMNHRLTPLEFDTLRNTHDRGQLVSENAAEKYQAVIALWFADVNRMMLDSGKQQLEAFSSRRIMPTITHFSAPTRTHGDVNAQTLLVCFPGAGDRQLLMPNAVFLQHTDSSLYDVLMIGEPLKKGYRLGIPLLGRNVSQVVESICQLPLIKNYSRIRTVGVSAGGHAAIIAAYHLRAELGVSVGGRFHSERYPHRILDRIFRISRAVLKGGCPQVLMAYAADKTRDRNFARVIGKITGGSLFGLEFSDGLVGHLIFERLAERGELSPYLVRTLFAKVDTDLLKQHKTNVIMTLPGNTIRDVDAPSS